MRKAAAGDSGRILAATSWVLAKKTHYTRPRSDTLIATLGTRMSIGYAPNFYYYFNWVNSTSGDTGLLSTCYFL